MILEILTALLVIITGFYAWATFRILRANEKVVEVARQESENLMRPYIAIGAFINTDSIIFLSIENTGRTPANNLEFLIDKNFYRFGNKNDRENLRSMELFKSKIECFPPGTRILYDLGTGPCLFGKHSDHNITPLVFSITANYKFGKNYVNEKTSIDLRMFLHSSWNRNPVAAELKSISKQIGELPSAIVHILKR